MKTRAQIYEREAAALLRDISMYQVITEKQLFLLHPGKEDKTRNLLAYLVRQNRVWQVDDFYCAAQDSTEDMDRGLLAAVWVLTDFIDRVEYHSVGDYPAKIIFFADGEVYEIIHAAQGKDCSVDWIEQAVDCLPMMAERTLVEVTDFDLFKAGEKDREAYIRILSGLPDYCCLVFLYDLIEYRPDARTKLARR